MTKSNETHSKSTKKKKKTEKKSKKEEKPKEEEPQNLESLAAADAGSLEQTPEALAALFSAVQTHEFGAQSVSKDTEGEFAYGRAVYVLTFCVLSCRFSIFYFFFFFFFFCFAGKLPPLLTF